MKKEIYTIHALYKILRHTKVTLNDLSKLSKTKEGEECVVLANGPSLTDSLKIFEKSNFLDHKQIFVVNNFVETEYYESYRPRYYVLADPAYWGARESEAAFKIKEKAVKNLNEKTAWSINLLLPVAAQGSKLIGELKNDYIRIQYYNNTPVTKGYEYLLFKLYQYNWATPQQQTVLISAIYTALNIGFKKIYVFGADHSWHENLVVGKDNYVYMRDPHFYDPNAQQLNLYIRGDGKPSRISEVFEDSILAFENHQILNSYANYLNAKIYNASSKSYVDAYDRFEVKINE